MRLISEKNLSRALNSLARSTYMRNAIDPECEFRLHFGMAGICCSQFTFTYLVSRERFATIWLFQKLLSVCCVVEDFAIRPINTTQWKHLSKNYFSLVRYEFNIKFWTLSWIPYGIPNNKSIFFILVCKVVWKNTIVVFLGKKNRLFQTMEKTSDKFIKYCATVTWCAEKGWTKVYYFFKFQFCS